MPTLRPVHLLALMLAALPLCACGGGGGGAAPLSDDYAIVAVGAFAATDPLDDDEAQALWGVTTLDGLGELTGTYDANFAGTITLAESIPAGTTYTFGSSGDANLLFGGTNSFDGTTDAGDDLALTTNVTAGDQPATLALVRLGSGYSTAMLENFYRFCAWGVDPAGNAFSLIGSMTLNGTRGTGTAAVATNTEGTVTTSGAVGVTYSVSSDGQMTLDLDGLVMDGVLFRDGEAMLLAGGTDASSPPVMFAAIRQGSGLSDASFSGTYTLVGIERDGTGFTSLLGTVVANGVGTLNSNFTRNEDGVIVGSAPSVDTYEVSSDGGVSIEPTGPGPIGGITQDGNFVIIGGPPVSGNPAMYLLIRR
ncbi:MAG: hypothetical protein QNJ90_13085 [Planctomycetota bacterium]|nr:hypothetical protein [Planctomycetota bacterium]